MKLQAECVLCETLYTEEDILSLLFFSATRICYRCYKKLYRSDKSISCFGKQYDPMALECRELCPDRKICPKFFTGKIFKLRKRFESKIDLINIKPEKIVIRKYPFRQGSIIDRAFKMAIRGVLKSKLKRWCERHSTSYYRITKVLKRQNKYGKKWTFDDDGERIKVGYTFW
jgi:hypothetical protein